MNPPVLTVNNLTKYYGQIRALNNISFNVPEGSVFGILGPNGSGKTTMLGIIMDILRATSGSFLFFGQASSATVRKQVGTLLETPNFYHYLSGEKNLRIAAEIKGKGHEQIPSVLRRVNLYERRQSKFSTYSLGMKQRLAIASCLLGDPKVLVFDEPTNGLDPVGIAEIRSLIKQLAGEGKTIIMASHLLDEVEKVCTHVAILKQGNLITSGHVDEVLVNEDIVEVSAKDITGLENALHLLNGYLSIKVDDRQIQLHYPTATADLEKINRHCFNNGIVLTHLQLKKKSLESKFLELTNEG
ncbi:ATP-binding cassette domain-containing protein [Danxiaibacter flavus]|uniref:ATP-binding cassette domain-containing protein n=1 Tax=Danxiaibacter flavus TaxID=3049108 RepID=A0ABV3ZD30_9BACT|nr:ATP-binding cassette domain-containing protein [Chitinophagaceae bacterium DXS]